MRSDVPKLKGIAQITSMRRLKKESCYRYAARIQYYIHCYGVQDNNDHVLGSLLKSVEGIQNQPVTKLMIVQHKERFTSIADFTATLRGFVGPFGSEDYNESTDKIGDQSASTRRQK
ncbi:hypothetical protein BGX20_000521 [Mortierella sp. AD010]|nr:hypothetical protein BGX20_000521 [Mortierella sp. AD010]